MTQSTLQPRRHLISNGISPFPSWPQLDEEMIDAATRVLRSGKLNYWTGTEGRDFEREFADYVGCRHAVAVANGTVALELALTSLGIGAGAEVIVPSRTFVATASAVSRCGATPVFADIDANSQNITVESIRQQLTRRTRAIIVVHLAGWPCDMDPILEIAHKRKLWVIEDCAQAHGARYKGRPVGSLGDVAAFSFCQDKIITTAGEGGMLVTNHHDVWQRAWSYKDHGKNYEAAHEPASSAGFRWLHDSIGTNWRLTEVQAAIGRIALRRLDEWIAARRRNAAILNDGLNGCSLLRTTLPPADAFHSYYKYYAFVRPERLAAGWSRDRLVEEIIRAGVPCFSGSCSEIYLEKAFDRLSSKHSPAHLAAASRRGDLAGFSRCHFPADWIAPSNRPKMGRLCFLLSAFDRSLRPAERHPTARALGETSLMLLVHPTLNAGHMHKAVRAVRAIISTAMRAEHATVLA